MSSGNILVSRTLGKDEQGNTQESEILLSLRKNVLGALIMWMLQRTMGAILVEQRCRWSAAQVGVTSALRLPSNKLDGGKLSDEGGAVDILARSACGLKIFVLHALFLQSTCTALQPKLEFLAQMKRQNARTSCSEVSHTILVQSTPH